MVVMTMAVIVAMVIIMVMVVRDHVVRLDDPGAGGNPIRP